MKSKNSQSKEGLITWADLLPKRKSMEQKTTYELKDNTGSIWLDVQTKQGQNGEDYTVRSGSCKINGVEYWINAYERETKTGKKLLSCTFKSKNLGTLTTTETAPF